ncbi:MAG TPA: hypothetical protein VFM34_10775 [Moraxellaceae bacterium]|nr:hypothetical protein [Moraxellaceae bacterium]
MMLRRIVMLLLASLMSMPVAADTQVMVTGEWPPSTGVDEPEGGTMTAIVTLSLFVVYPSTDQ